MRKPRDGDEGRRMIAHVSSAGWATYIISRPRPSISLSNYLSSLTSFGHARFIHLTDLAWSFRDSIARPLSLNLYTVRDAIPQLVVTPNVLVIAVANALHVYDLVRGGLEVHWRGEVQLHRGSAHDDITGLGALPQPGGKEALFVSCANGKMLRVQLSQPGEPLRATVTAHYTHPPRHITSLSTSRWESKAALALTTAQGGLVSLHNTRSPWIEPTHVSPPTAAYLPAVKQPRTWCSFIARSDSLAVTGSTHLSLHPILPSGLQQSSKPHIIPGPLKQSACYALSHPPNHHPDILLSGWHDGVVRMHDLRTEAIEMTLRDPWSDSGVYCVGAGGGSATQVIAGYSKHGMLAIFDIRSPSTAYTTYAPSPSLGPPRPHNGFTQVSALHVEASRIFGTTPHRPFVLDFGPDITESSYPFVKERPRRMTANGLGFSTQSYDHLLGLPR
ncbi:hypothetical protein FRC12_013264 [Ceratobasidium sp. 428]|nr:hypothetical protein FRC12_013264 [Ceratobasidium sp. 428]